MTQAAPYPFPGLNPYFEEQWFQVHPSMIVYVRNQLTRQLPADLLILIEQGVSISAQFPEDDKRPRPDASVWKLREDTLLSSAPPNFSPPLTLSITSPKPRHLAIREKSGNLVTAIELLSPANKHSGGALTYLQKRQHIINLGVNLVEVDLIRKWGLALEQFESEEMAESIRLSDGRMPAHSVNVFRSENPLVREIYPITYSHILPAIRVPLRPDDQDIWLNLQELAEQCHADCGFDKSTQYTRDPEPPLTPEDTTWLDTHLKFKNLR